MTSVRVESTWRSMKVLTPALTAPPVAAAEEPVAVAEAVAVAAAVSAEESADPATSVVPC